MLEIIKDAAQNYATHDLTSRNLMLALYLAAKFREKKAFNSIVQIASLPGDWPDEFFPGAVGDSLSGFLLSTYDGNLDALKGLVENEAIHDSSRELALEAIVGLVSLGRIRRNEIISYFRTFLLLLCVMIPCLLPTLSGIPLNCTQMNCCQRYKRSIEKTK